MKNVTMSALRIGFLLLVGFLCNHLAVGQVLYGTVVGNVTSPNGDPVAGATVIAIETQTGIRHQQTTDTSGYYSLHDLQPGIYELRITVEGFSSVIKSGMSVGANLIVRFDQKLSLSRVTQIITVQASPTQMQTDSGSLNAEVSSKQLNNLPINGYDNYQSMLSLLPGATPSRYQNSEMDTVSRSLTTNINGASRTNNATLIDGAAIQQIYLPHNTLYNPPTEDIQSVNIVTNSFTAEQGLAGGAVVTVLTKSGTNDFHGTLWEGNTNSSVSARNYFYNTTYFKAAQNSVPKNIQNQFGGNLGGPIFHDKLFFFTGYEGLTQRQFYGGIFSVPTDPMRTGDFTGLATIYDPNTGNSDGTGRVSFASENADGRNAIETPLSPASLNMLALMPHANLSGTTSNYSVGGTTSLDRFSYDEKLTWQVDPKSSMFGKFSFLSAQVNAPTNFGAAGGTGLIPGTGGGSGNSQTDLYVAGIGYTRTISNHLFLDANAGVGHNHLEFYEIYENPSAQNPAPALGIPGTNSDGDGSYGPDPLQAGLPSFAVTGFDEMGDTDSYAPEIKHDYTFTYAANLTYAFRTHTFRFGTQLLNNRMNEYQPQRGFGPRGGFTFTGGVTALKGAGSPTSANAFAQYLLGLPDSLGKSYQYFNPMTAIEWQSGVYAQDEWQATRKMTITYGLRWEYYPIFRRDNQGIERYDLTTNNVILGGVDGQPSNAGSDASKKEFVPRLGIAYRINEKTVFRGGYGISTDPYPFSRAMRDPYPTVIAQTVNANNSYVSAGSFVTGIPGYATVEPVINNGLVQMPLGAYTKTLEPGTYRRGYLESWNVTVERALPADFDLAASYVGAQTIRLTAYIEANAGQTPGLGSAGQPLDVAFGRNAETQVIDPYATTHYNALQLYLKHALKNGVSLTAAYTFSKSIDLNTDDDSTPLFNAVAYQYRNRAVSDFDRKHMFQSGFTAQLPFGKGHRWLNSSGFVNAISGGWSVDGIASKVTGLPFTPTASATSLNAPFNTQVANQVSPHVKTLGGIGKFATWFDTTAFAPVTTANFGTASRNSLRGPGSSDLDLGISRTFLIIERFGIEVRADAFNVTNTPNFANPASNVSSSSFGEITSTAGGAADSRVMRLSGKFNF